MTHRYDSELTTAKIRHARSERLHGWSHHLSHDFRKSSRLERVLQKRSTATPFNQRFFPSLKFPWKSAGLGLCWCYPDLLCWYSIQPSLPWSLPLFEHSQTLMGISGVSGGWFPGTPKWERHQSWDALPYHLERLCSQQSFANTIFVSWSFM